MDEPGGDMRFGRIVRSVTTGAIVLGLAATSIGVAGAVTSAATPKAKAKALPAAQLDIVAYSTPTQAFASLIAAFQATPQGKNITFTQSYGASGEQTRAIIAGQKADIVDLSLQPDMQKLVDAGIVAPSWNKNQYNGFITDSVAVIVTRAGNPDKLKDWADLTKSGVETITPNPFTSGAAKWNILSAYGATSDLGKNQQAGLDYLTKLFEQVPVQDSSGRAALQTFTSGKGDALLTYENEAILAKNAGQPIDYTIPDKTLLIQNPIAVTKNSAHPKQAKAFLDFLYSKRAAQIWADNGYRPVISGAIPADQFKTPKGLFTIEDLGGWAAIDPKFFDPSNGLFTAIEKNLGVSTSKS
jgi:sulfate transport system substrate-binding protein